MTYHLTEFAEEDVINVLQEGIELFGIRQADRYYNQLLATFEFLAQNPRAAREREDVTPTIRAHPFGSHMIIYRVVNDDILIVAVRHSRQDWRSFDR